MMSFVHCSMKNTLRAIAFLLALAPGSLPGQGPPPEVRAKDTVTVVAGAHFQAGGLRRWFLGGTYRELWTKPIRVPVLDLHTFAGGLRPTKLSGGFETKSLRFMGADGVEYNFRSIDKDHVVMPGGLADVRIAQGIALDLVSNSHPASALIVASLLESAGVLHESPTLVVMPDDPTLGEYRKVFARRLGTISRYPVMSKGDVPSFAGALNIIDSDTLLKLLNRNPAEQADVEAFLAARLTDMLVNNWDRHPGQWKWARFRAAGPWEPISRDYDKSFNAVSGVFPGLVRMSVPTMVHFDSTYPSMRALTFNSLQFDRRMLAGLSRPTWDSVARAVAARISNEAIDAAMNAMPPEYRFTAPAMAAKLRARRDSLPAVAERFYRFLTGIVDIHATDAADHATITRVDDAHVQVQLDASDGTTYFSRSFDAAEVTEIRVYLHGGSDFATIKGDVHHSIPVRVIGGNGTNTLVDSSTVNGHHAETRLYDEGATSDVNYGGKHDTLFSRRPWVRMGSSLMPPNPDRGGGFAPSLGFSINHDYGIVPRVGLRKFGYSFGHYPYSSLLALDARYSLKLSRYKVGLQYDKRFELSDMHFTALAQSSQLELVNFHGFGNDAPQLDSAFFIARQTQRLFRPAIARSLSSVTELSLGAVIQQSVTDTTAGHFVSDTRPYGFGTNGRFGELGLQLGLHLDTRDQKRHAHRGNIVDLTASYFPAAWDVTSSFGSIDALLAQYFTIPVPLHPFVALRAGGKKVWGNFPFQEAAFLGGTNSIRTENPQSYAGDAVVYATAEIRIPVVKFSLIVPLNTGLLATEDVGRVYVNGASPGGWHSAFGAGFWVGFHELTADIRLMRREDGRPVVIGFRLAVPAGGP